MKNRAYAVVLAATVALLAASGASAKAAAVHVNVKVTSHGAVKPSQKATLKRIERRMVRGL